MLVQRNQCTVADVCISFVNISSCWSNISWDISLGKELKYSRSLGSRVFSQSFHTAFFVLNLGVCLFCEASGIYISTAFMPGI